MRTKEQIQDDFYNTCAQIGDKIYQIDKLNAAIASLRQKFPILETELKEVTDAAVNAPGIPEQP